MTNPLQFPRGKSNTTQSMVAAMKRTSSQHPLLFHVKDMESTIVKRVEVVNFDMISVIVSEVSAEAREAKERAAADLAPHGFRLGLGFLPEDVRLYVW